jgi:polar amino acid transport system permease protein
MAEHPAAPLAESGPVVNTSETRSVGRRLVDLPWWFFGIVVIALWAAFTIATNANYTTAALRIFTGGKPLTLASALRWAIFVTLRISLVAYLIAAILGLITGLARMSNNVVLKNASRLYIELVRGIPMLVLIFFIALVLVPAAIGMIHGLGEWLNSLGLTAIGGVFSSIDPRKVPMEFRAVIALAITYGAFLAEVFRAGIQSIGRGQMEAARSLGMSYGHAMRYVILPQAIRNILPALGNDFVSMVKDSSLVSLLAVGDITQSAKLYSGSTFRFREAYVTLSVLYLTMTVLLSLGVQAYERSLRGHE